MYNILKIFQSKYYVKVRKEQILNPCKGERRTYNLLIYIKHHIKDNKKDGLKGRGLNICVYLLQLV